MSDWDFDHQKAETAWTIHNLCQKQGLTEGMMINLDLQFIPGEGADAQAFIRALGMFGYAVTQDSELVQAEVEGTAFTLDGIWEHEERCTKIALARGFVPDGWGFWEP